MFGHQNPRSEFGTGSGSVSGSGLPWYAGSGSLSGFNNSGFTTPTTSFYLSIIQQQTKAKINSLHGKTGFYWIPFIEHSKREVIFYLDISLLRIL
jgi:hypothetical protein